MQKKSIYTVLLATFAMVVAALTMVFTLGKPASAFELETGKPLLLNSADDFYIENGVLLGLSQSVYDAVSANFHNNCGSFAPSEEYSEIHMVIPDTVVTIGEDFMHHYYVVDETGVENVYFNGINPVVTSVVIPENVTTIGAHAFEYCNFSTIKLPESLTSIGDYAFSDLNDILNSSYASNGYVLNLCDEITIPASVTTIGVSAFQNSCIDTINFAPNSQLTSIGAYAFANTYITEINLPTSITTIGERMYFGCGYLTRVTLPAHITTIEDYAFCDCNSLFSLTIPASVTNISEYAFNDMYQLRKIIVEDPALMSNANLANYVNIMEVAKFVVAFNANGGVLDGDQQKLAEYGQTVVVPSATREGYNFLGWFDANDHEFTNTTSVTGNISLYAKWESTTSENLNTQEPEQPANNEEPASKVNVAAIAGGTAGGAVGLGTIGTIVGLAIRKRRRLK